MMHPQLKINDYYLTLPLVTILECILITYILLCALCNIMNIFSTVVHSGHLFPKPSHNTTVLNCCVVKNLSQHNTLKLLCCDNFHNTTVLKCCVVAIFHNTTL